jgi:hypothetical protein
MPYFCVLLSDGVLLGLVELGLVGGVMVLSVVVPVDGAGAGAVVLVVS